MGDRFCANNHGIPTKLETGGQSYNRLSRENLGKRKINELEKPYFSCIPLRTQRSNGVRSWHWTNSGTYSLETDLGKKHRASAAAGSDGRTSSAYGMAQGSKSEVKKL